MGGTVVVVIGVDHLCTGVTLSVISQVSEDREAVTRQKTVTEFEGFVGELGEPGLDLARALGRGAHEAEARGCLKRGAADRKPKVRGCRRVSARECVIEVAQQVKPHIVTGHSTTERSDEQAAVGQQPGAIDLVWHAGRGDALRYRHGNRDGIVVALVPLKAGELAHAKAVGQALRGDKVVDARVEATALTSSRRSACYAHHAGVLGGETVGQRLRTSVEVPAGQYCREPAVARQQQQLVAHSSEGRPANRRRHVHAGHSNTVHCASDSPHRDLGHEHMFSDSTHACCRQPDAGPTHHGQPARLHADVVVGRCKQHVIARPVKVVSLPHGLLEQHDVGLVRTHETLDVNLLVEERVAVQREYAQLGRRRHATRDGARERLDRLRGLLPL
ncbi:MAG: hypothetical protein BGO47_06710 [Microbacterium sp. 67-17]|nr:MAG: hypothetical protein BGO47_06710 [Microbacterium sp. 67-17]